MTTSVRPKSDIERSLEDPLGINDNNVDFWNIEQPQTPVASFKNHGDAVREFLWRSESIANDFKSNQYQLLTWSFDGTICCQKLQTKHYEVVGVVNVLEPETTEDQDPFIMMKAFWKPSPKIFSLMDLDNKTESANVDEMKMRPTSSGTMDTLSLATPTIKLRRETDASIEARIGKLEGKDGWSMFRRDSNVSNKPSSPGIQTQDFLFTRASTKTPITDMSTFFNMDDDKESVNMETPQSPTTPKTNFAKYEDQRKVPFPELRESRSRQIDLVDALDVGIRTKRSSSIPRPPMTPTLQRRTGSMTADMLAEHFSKNNGLVSPISSKSENPPFNWLSRLSIGSNNGSVRLSRKTRISSDTLADVAESSSKTNKRKWRLEDEVEAVRRRIPAINFDRIESRGIYSCEFVLECPWTSSVPIPIRVAVRFPKGYPDESVPAIANIVSGKNVGSSLLSLAARSSFASDITQITNTCASQRWPCLEPIAKYILGEHLKADDEYPNKGDNNRDDMEEFVLGLGKSKIIEQDPSRVPYPRFCSAFFLPDGFFLVIILPNSWFVGQIAVFFQTQAYRQLFKRNSGIKFRDVASSPHDNASDSHEKVSTLENIQEGCLPRSYNPRGSLKNRSILQRYNSRSSYDSLSADEESYLQPMVAFRVYYL